MAPWQNQASSERKPGLTQDLIFRLFLRLGCFAALYLLGIIIFYRLGLASQAALAVTASASFAVMAVALGLARANRRRRVDRRVATVIAAGAALILFGAMYWAPATHLLVGPFLFSGLAAGAHRLSCRTTPVLGAVALCAYLGVTFLLYPQTGNAALLQMQLLHALTAVLALPGFVLLAGRLHNLSGALHEASSKLHDINEDARRDHLTGCYNRRYTATPPHCSSSRNA